MCKVSLFNDTIIHKMLSDIKFALDLVKLHCKSKLMVQVNEYSKRF